ncbi:hypothetical protein [Blastococcus mobilis]|uniref:Uncharacterized protein n=1 Tax=Blastococcus mobilis TaxID=1938746 RepID=A0A238XCF0_9ACTN|nr:hypothetical protein [Blastococcus mobilis]SNR56248.1 hypothetical protein SAMN06272737_112145 [Blastococcus mobilis]
MGKIRLIFLADRLVPVTGWYLVDGADTPVGNINVGDTTVAGFLYYVLPEYSTRHPERVDAYADAVAQIPGLAAKVQQVRSRGWSGWSSMPLSRAAEMQEVVLTPIAVATR